MSARAIDLFGISVDVIAVTCDDVEGADMSELLWEDKVPTIAIHPDMASRRDIARLASELMEARHELQRLQSVVGKEDYESIKRVLEIK